MWIFLFNFTFLNGIVYKTTFTFMSSETLSENKLASISSLKAANDVDLVRSYLRDIGRVPLLSHEQKLLLVGRFKNTCRLKEPNWKLLN